MITQKKITAKAISGETARACESCLKLRARWFCPADDAFLCQACDSAVHSANELAGRHKRVRLQLASFTPVHHHQDDVNNVIVQTDKNKQSCVSSMSSDHSLTLPTWHQGFTRRARTPRQAKRAKSSARERQTMMTMPVVPEMSGDEGSVEEENEEQMVFSVPTYDPFEVLGHDDEFNSSLIGFEGEGMPEDWENFPRFDLQSENDLAEFAADVESLLKQGTGEEVHLSVPLMTSRETDYERVLPSEKGGFLKNEAVIKVKEDEDERAIETCDQLDWAMELENKVLNFEANQCQVKGAEEEDEEKEEKKEGVEREIKGEGSMEIEGNRKRRKIFLRLNYEEVINAWVGSSPWITGRRPEFDLDRDGWPKCMGGVNYMDAYHQEGGVIGGRTNVNGGDDGRQARLSRYREKRRTRLFSKKIRYEVRKLNAEKRPRLKGRFVKRTSLAPAVGLKPTFSYVNK